MHFFEALLRHLGLDQAIEIRNFGGVAEFKRNIIALANSNEFKNLVTSVGVIRDAEDQPAASARQSILDGLVAAGLTAARTPPIKTAVFVLPDDARPGMIETLCVEATKTEPSLADAWTCVDEFFACLTTRKIALPTDVAFAKNQAQAFLATRDDVQLFPGQAAYKGHWPFDNKLFDPLKTFLRYL